jgi:hypothetical protein
MKTKKLLGLAAAAFFGMSAYAQEVPTDGGIYYLYNTESGQFLTRGNNWGTRGITRPVGMPWQVALSNGTYTLQMYDLGTGHLNDESFTDTDNGGAATFTLSGDANGYTLAYNGGYLEAPATAGNINVKGATASKWQFLTQAQYDAKLAAIASAQEAAIAQTAGITLSSGQTLADAIKDYAITSYSDGVPTKDAWGAWAVVNRAGNSNQGGYGCEIYQGGGGYKKTITGLKQGIYKVTVKGLKRVGTNDRCYAMGQAGYNVSDAFMIANGNVVPVASWYSACTSSSAPNSTDAAKAIWNNENNPGYKSSVFTYVGADGNLAIEATSEAYWGSSWFLFGGVDYVYYSDAVSDEMVNDLIASIPSGKVYSAYRQELDDAKAALEANPNLTNYNRLSKAVETAEANVSQYQNLSEAISTFSAAYTAVSPDAKSALSAAIQTAQGVYDNASVENTSATIAALEAAVNNANVTDYSYVKATYPDAVVLGDWTTNTFGTTSGQGYMDNSQRYYDQWKTSAFDLNLAQDIELPAGEYVLYGIGRGQAKLSNVELFVSYGQTENVVPFRMKGDLGFGVDVDGVANFSADATYNNAPNGRGWEYRYIAFELAEPTTITVGVRGSVGTNGASWAGVFAPVLASKPNLSVALANLTAAIAEADKVSTDAVYNASVKQTFTQAYSAAKSAESSTDKTTIDDATSALETATSAANTSVKNYEAAATYINKAANLDDAGKASYAGDATVAAVAEAYNARTLEAVSDNQKAAMDEALVTAVKAQTTAGSDMTLAIVNPGFENDFTGWENTGLVIQKNGEKVQVGSKYAEIWQPNGTFDVHQTITLPKGYYTVTIREIDRNLPSPALLYANEETVDFYGKNEADELSLNFYIDSKTNVTIGAMCKGDGTANSWFAVDNFRLTYNGADKPAPVIADLTVNDGVAVEASQDAKNITYVREFKAANKWQSLYLPFSVNLENNEADVVLAKVDDVVAEADGVVINIVKVSATETVEACKPLFIAAKTVGVKNIKTGVSTVASPNDGGNEYSAAEFTGILSEASAGQAGKYVMSGGELCLVPQSMDNLTLGVNRWAMTVNGGNGVRIRINAEGFNSDEATAIASAVAESVENGEIFSINGAKVKDAKSGLYIKGGKKVLVK